MHAQIEQWEKAKSYNVINRYRQYIYQILSGDIKRYGITLFALKQLFSFRTKEM